MLARRDRKRRPKARLFFLVPPRVTQPHAAASGAAARTSASTWGFELGKVLLEHANQRACGLVELVLVLPSVDRIENLGRHGRYRKPKYLYMALAFSHDGAPLPGDDWITEVIIQRIWRDWTFHVRIAAVSLKTPRVKLGSEPTRVLCCPRPAMTLASPTMPPLTCYRPISELELVSRH